MTKGKSVKEALTEQKVRPKHLSRFVGGPLVVSTDKDWTAIDVPPARKGKFA